MRKSQDGITSTRTRTSQAVRSALVILASDGRVRAFQVSRSRHLLFPARASYSQYLPTWYTEKRQYQVRPCLAVADGARCKYTHVR